MSREVALLVERETGPLGMRSQGGQAPILQELVNTGIDDLAKYRIVQYLRECAGPADGASIAAFLGLRPLEVVDEALESLASDGILVRAQIDPPLYILSGHPAMSAAIESLFSPATAQQKEQIFRALASASLAKARDRARGNGGEPKG